MLCQTQLSTSVMDRFDKRGKRTQTVQSVSMAELCKMFKMAILCMWKWSKWAHPQEAHVTVHARHMVNSDIFHPTE
jgi:hypothetical protein